MMVLVFKFYSKLLTVTLLNLSVLLSKLFKVNRRLARFASLTQETLNSSIARTQMLDEIRMIPVDSSNIAAIGYSAVCRVLQVDFLTGRRYRYHDVPSQVFDGFLAASSKGRFLNNFIKPEYPHYQRRILT